MTINDVRMLLQTGAYSILKYVSKLSEKYR